MDRRAVLLAGAGAFGLAGWEMARGGRAVRLTGAAGEGVATPAPQPPALGINLTPINYYNPVAFIDRMKGSSIWETYGKPAPMDARGLPQSMGGEHLIHAMVPCEPGRYVLLHDGDLDERLQGGVIREKTRGRVLFETVQLETGFRQLILNAVRKPPTFMHLVREEEAAAFAKGEIFAPAFLAQLKGFRSLRFMDWMRVNGSAVTDRYTPVDRCSYETGVPISVMAALAKRVGAHPWICVPHLATDALAREMIAGIRSGMGDGPVPYVEFSNEVWNTGFGQGRYAGEQAAALGGAGTPAGVWYGYKAGHLARLARGSGCRVVLGSITAAPYRAAHVWDGVRRAGAEDRDFFGWIIATYVTGTLTNAGGPTLALAARRDTGAAIENLLSATGPGAGSVTAMAPIYAAHGAVAAEHGLELIAYEGNMHLNALPAFGAQRDAVSAFFGAVAADPGAARVMDANLDAFQAAGGRLACLYNLSSAPGPNGAFGLVGSGAWSAVQRRLAARA